MSTILLVMTSIYLLETIVRLKAFAMVSSKMIWLAGGIASIIICYIWNWVSQKRSRRDSFALIIGFELFFIGASLLGFGTAYIFIPEKSAYMDINLWPIGVFLELGWKFFDLFTYYVGLELFPLTIMISIPVIGCILVLISFPLCFHIETEYWPRIALACSVYGLANVFDYIMTVNGIMAKKSPEGNPLIQKYIDHFGLLSGVLIHKLVMFAIVVSGVILISLRYNDDERENSLLPESLLYWGSAITFVAVALWLKLFG